MSFDGRSCYIDQILHSIDDGRLSYEETERRLQKLIDDETYQLDHPADAALISACQTLLIQLHSHGKISFESHLDSNWQALQSTLARRRQRIRFWSKWGSIAAAMVLVVATTVLGAFHFNWFEQTSSPNQQQYMVQGREITLQMIESAIAEHDEFATFTVDNLSQLKQHLGFEPLIPSKLGNGLSMKRCYVAFFPEEILVGISYMKGMDESYGLTFTVDYYTDMSNAFMNIEQSGEGSYYTIEDVPVYISKNINETVACWQEGNAVCSLSISALLKDYESIISEFLGGN